MRFTVLCKYFKELFFGIAKIQLYFHATKYLGIYFRQISNFFVGLLERESYTAIRKELLVLSIRLLLVAFNTTKIRKYF